MSDRQKYNYRICDKCGKEWNVSKKYPTSQGYICPDCRYMKKHGHERRVPTWMYRR